MQKRIETIFKSGLPVDEALIVRRCRYMPDHLRESDIRRLPRLAVVTGIHGDELEGQYLCFALARAIAAHPDRLSGIVDIYPAVNTLGIDSICRSFPNFELDMNRVFPGSPNSLMIERLASSVVESLDGADLVLDVHASNIFLKELPQARIDQTNAEGLMPLAQLLNLDILWIHLPAKFLESTLAHSLNSRNTPCIVVEMGVGMRITREFGNQLLSGVFCVMRKLGIWQSKADDSDSVRTARSSLDREIHFMNAKTSGIFVPGVDLPTEVSKNQRIGQILDPLDGTIREDLLSPCDGLLFTLREYPVVYSGSLVARVLEGADT